jgi:predicted nucleotidyltransferase
MIRTIELTQEDRAVLLGVLRRHLPSGTKVWAFGSRTTGKARRYSDLDLAVLGGEGLDFAMLGRLREALSESDLTIKVDIVDLLALDPGFRRIIEGQMVPFCFQGS